MENVKSKKDNQHKREFDFNKDTPFFEERSYGHRVGKGDETYHVNTYTEEEMAEWLKNN